MSKKSKILYNKYSREDLQKQLDQEQLENDSWVVLIFMMDAKHHRRYYKKQE